MLEPPAQHAYGEHLGVVEGSLGSLAYGGGGLRREGVLCGRV
jgi:hypothetical protein